jgi:hypothetical protein
MWHVACGIWVVVSWKCGAEMRQMIPFGI